MVNLISIKNIWTFLLATISEKLGMKLKPKQNYEVVPKIRTGC